jgi:uncharacterized coiled-coil protein SlyX
MNYKEILRSSSAIIKSQEQIIDNLYGVIEEQDKMIMRLADMLELCTKNKEEEVDS